MAKIRISDASMEVLRGDGNEIKTAQMVVHVASASPRVRTAQYVVLVIRKSGPEQEDPRSVVSIMSG
jgi:hypothetical protein